MSFDIYLSNTLNKDLYDGNTTSQFINVIKPPIIFQNSGEWEVGLKSCILPFQSYSDTSHGENIFELLWIIKKKSHAGFKTLRHKISISYKVFLNKTPEKILKIILEHTEKITRIKNVFRDVLNVTDEHLAITRTLINEEKTEGDLANIVSIILMMDKGAQYVLGFNSQKYIIYSTNGVAEDRITDTIVGNKKVNFETIPSPYILLYTDIIQSVNFGSHRYQILDILPFGKSKLTERKINEPSYRTVSKNVIENVSISIYMTRPIIL